MSAQSSATSKQTDREPRLDANRIQRQGPIVRESTEQPAEILEVVADFLKREHHHFIGGEQHPTDGGVRGDVLNPATGEVLSTIAIGSVADADVAVAAARDGFETWSALMPSEREANLHAFADLVVANKAELAQLEALDNGKPLTMAMGVDVNVAASQLRYFAGWPTKLRGETYPVSSPGYHVYTRREPLGVCAAITPWNYSLVMAMQKIAPALAAGNSLVLKPAELTSLTALYLADLANQAGLPPGTFNVVTGRGSVIGAALSEHRDVSKIAFTGSTDVGREILHASTTNIKYSSLELGGKSPLIIFDDADIEAATESAMWAIFANSGQNCVAGSRLFIQSGVYDEVIDRLVALTEELVVGPGMNPDSDLGPLISANQLASVLSYVDQGKAAGATLLTGGDRCGGDLADGYFMSPTIFADVGDDAVIANEEIFGPVLTVFRFDTDEEVYARANHPEFGLAAAVWTENVRRSHAAAAKLRAGVVWVNTYDWFDPAVPFGGSGQSGLGRELGPSAMDMYTELKSVWINIDQS